MSSQEIPLIVVNAVRAIINEAFVIEDFRQLPSRRNQVYHIVGKEDEDKSSLSLIAKWFLSNGIAHETTILKEAFSNQVKVPQVIGTTSDVLLLEYISGHNLCDLITEDPNPEYGGLLGDWFATFHSSFQRDKDTVLVKGDARIRNFIYIETGIVGVDFEESYYGSPLDDLATACASILDTDPVFTNEKLKICRVFLQTYNKSQKIAKNKALRKQVTQQMMKVLQLTLERRDNPPALEKAYKEFASGDIKL